MDSFNYTEMLNRARRLSEACEYETLQELLEEFLPAAVPESDLAVQVHASLLVLRAESRLVIGRWDEAGADARLVLGLATRLKDRSALVLALLVLGTLLKNRGELPEAADAYVHALQVAQAVQDKLGSAEAHLNLGIIASKMGQGKEAHEHLASAREQVNRETTRRGRRLECSVLVQEAVEAMRRQPPEEVTALCKKALEALGPDQQVPEAGEAHRFLGVIASRQLQNREALMHHTNALSIYKKSAHLFGQAKVYNSIGQTLLSLSRSQEAAHFMLKAETLCNQLGALSEAATMYGKLGQVYLQQEDYQRAIEYFQKDLQISRKLGGKRALAYIHRNLGEAYTQAEAYSEAIVHFKDALQSFQQLEDETSVGQVYLELCRYYLRQGQLERARGMLQWAHSIIHKLKLPPELARLNLVTGMLLHAEKKLAEAEDKLREADEFYSFREPTEPHVEAAYHYGLVLVELGRRDRATERLQAALQMARNLGLVRHAKRSFEALESIDEIGLIKALVESGS